MATKSNTQAKPETRQPTFDINDPAFQRIVAEAVAARMATERAIDGNKIDAAITRTFQKAGYANVVLFDRSKLLAEQPDCTVLIYSKWLELGRKVKPGEHAVRVRGYHLRLFHKDQTVIMTTAERKEAFKKRQEQTARRNAKPAAAAQAAA